MIRNESKPIQITGGIFLGFIAGLTPSYSLHWFGLIGLLFLLRINLLFGLLSFIFFSVTAPLLDSMTHSIGMHFLTERTDLLDIWTWLYHSKFLPYTRFNNSVVLGSLILSIAIGVPAFIISTLILKKKQTEWMKLYYRSEFWTYWSSGRLYRTYVMQRKT